MLSASVNGALPFVIIIFWAQGHTQQHPPTQTNHTHFPSIPNFFTGVKQLWLSTYNKDFWTAEFPKSQSDVQLILYCQEIKQILQFNEEQEWKTYPISIANIAMFWESMLLKAKFLLLEIRSFPNLAFQRFFFLVLEINSLQMILDLGRVPWILQHQPQSSLQDISGNTPKLTHRNIVSVYMKLVIDYYEWLWVSFTM